MRTRIALVAIVPVALITVSTCTQAALAEPVRVVPNSSRPTAVRSVPMAPVDAVVSRRIVPHPRAKGEAALPFIASCAAGQAHRHHRRYDHPEHNRPRRAGSGLGTTAAA